MSPRSFRPWTEARCQLLVDVPSTADCHDTEHTRARIDLVHDPISPDTISPLSLELSDEWDAFVRIDAQGPKSRPNAPLQVCYRARSLRASGRADDRNCG